MAFDKLMKKALDRLGKMTPGDLTPDEELICDLILVIKELHAFKMDVYEKYAGQIEILPERDKKKIVEH